MKAANENQMEAARQLLEILTEQERLIIKKDYPLTKTRNNLILKLSTMGARSSTLAEASGLGITQIERITHTARKRYVKEEVKSFELLVQMIRQHKDVFKTICQYLD